MGKPLHRPYLPSDWVKKIMVAGDLPAVMEYCLSSYGVECIKTEPVRELPPALSRHTDIQLVNPVEGVVVYAPGTSQEALTALKASGYELVPGETVLTGVYPGDIAYNSAIVGDKAFLHPRYTDRKVLDLLIKNKIRIIPVKQGYAKCSVLILTEEAIVTADPSIHQAALNEGLDSLLIPPQHSIVLKGYNYGFIGGTAGLISSGLMVFFGDYHRLDSWEAIGLHLEKYGIKPLALSNENPVDLGGLIPLCSV